MITIVDYGLGNLGSIANMIKKVDGESIISGKPEEIDRAEKIILPGVGSFDGGMQQIEERGLKTVLNKKALQDKIPVLGICLGMQLLTKDSQEGKLPGLGWINAHTKKFDLAPPFKIPHMGWNSIHPEKDDILLHGANNETRFYFVHSYYVECVDKEDILASTQYGIRFTSVLHHNNIWGAQFHPEKSHKFGKMLFRNFISI